ncbi:glutamate receptor ionotropic, delta-1-like [Palaemon carinicauda]|uniref:glutamate receptor ionotropic, delta-1-like n=1 Tax=Palaemon carinicauda TaxID=392227 RepID=UPI0035B5BD56
MIQSKLTERDEAKNLKGHKVRVVTTPFFPYADFEEDSDEQATTVTLLDSLDTRMLKTFSASMNFTYEVRVPWDNKPGFLLGNRKWTGKMGDIQEDKADVTTTTALTNERTAVIDFERTAPVDLLIILSLKPQLLPQYLVIIRPFTVEVWLSIALCIVLWGLSFWALQRLWSMFNSEKGITLNYAIYYSWAVILDDPPGHTPSSVSVQMLVGWWLVFSLLISTGFRSSLVAHLTVQGKTKPIDSFQDIVRLHGWKWGIEDRISGVAYPYFKKNTDPVVQKVDQSMQIISVHEGLKRTLEGGFSFLVTKNRIRSFKSSYSDNYGQTPFYISKSEYVLAPDIGWGFRKGAPYRDQISQLISRLYECGIANYWMEDIISSRVKMTGDKLKEDKNRGLGQTDVLPKATDESSNTIIRVKHLLGVFILIVLGFSIATAAFLGEYLIHRYYKDGQRDAI